MGLKGTLYHNIIFLCIKTSGRNTKKRFLNINTYCLGLKYDHKCTFYETRKLLKWFIYWYMKLHLSGKCVWLLCILMKTNIYMTYIYGLICNEEEEEEGGGGQHCECHCCLNIMFLCIWAALRSDEFLYYYKIPLMSITCILSMKCLLHVEGLKKQVTAEPLIHNVHTVFLRQQRSRPLWYWGWWIIDVSAQFQDQRLQTQLLLIIIQQTTQSPPEGWTRSRMTAQPQKPQTTT